MLSNVGAYPDDVPIVVGVFLALFLCLLISIIHVSTESWRHKDISYHVLDCGISIVYIDKEQRLIPWNEIKEIRVENGPCEPNSEFSGGPYGVYVILEDNIKSLFKVREKILNLTFSPNDLGSIQNMSIVRIFESSSLKRCYQVQDRLEMLKYSCSQE